ncbi:MAG: D-alanyl-D-alanine carboxypeptidase/D-alanyl-D-alanine-endopeptidase [Muribaculaceae bacterium]|nr:D-alanyl-D-alanine carboxypeptidase/D-alanyl-D-alanine-endopeptidase [Muribaculaceae bacterium]
MKIKSIISVVLLSSLCTLSVSAQTILDIDGEEATSVGIYIKDLATGEVLVDHNSQLALTPASVMKAITTASALSINGEDGRFVTPVTLRGTKGQAGVWNGDIIVHASADPTLESENFKSNLGFCDSIIAALKKKNINKISGTVIVQKSLKDEGPITQWEIEDIAWPYGAGLFGFNYRDNYVTIYPNRGETKLEVPDFEICVEKVDAGNDLVRGVYSNRLMVFTRDPQDKKWAINTSMPDPAAVFVAELKSRLKESGISVGDNQSSERGEETTLYRHTSPRYSEIMRSLMVRSDNMFAEGVLRSIAPNESRKNAIKREKELWATRGINTRYTIINDGSGLTRANRLSAHFIGDVLEWMANSDLAKTYTSFFPRAGKDGTMRGFLAKSPLTGALALKTGSVSAVQAYAGYKIDAEGMPTHVVVVLVNGFFCPRREVREATEKLLLDIFN